MQQQDPQQAPQSPDQHFKPVFTAEELRVLKECNIESFYYRSLPIAAALSAAAVLAMRKGVLKPSARLGYTPKVLGATLVGYFLGKVSYQSACAEKFMRIADSPVGEAMRKRKGRMGFQETMSIEPGFSIEMPTDESGPVHPRQPSYDGLDEYERGVTDSLSPYSESTPSSSQQYTNYEEMRRQNREEHIHRMAEKYRRPFPDAPSDNSLSNLPNDDPLGPPPPSRPSPAPGPPPRAVKKNQYGDDVLD